MHEEKNISMLNHLTILRLLWKMGSSPLYKVPFKKDGRVWLHKSSQRVHNKHVEASNNIGANQNLDRDNCDSKILDKKGNYTQSNYPDINILLKNGTNQPQTACLKLQFDLNRQYSNAPLLCFNGGLLAPVEDSSLSFYANNVNTLNHYELKCCSAKLQRTNANIRDGNCEFDQITSKTHSLDVADLKNINPNVSNTDNLIEQLQPQNVRKFYDIKIDVSSQNINNKHTKNKIKQCQKENTCNVSPKINTSVANKPDCVISSREDKIDNSYQGDENVKKVFPTIIVTDEHQFDEKLNNKYQYPTSLDTHTAVSGNPFETRQLEETKRKIFNYIGIPEEMRKNVPFDVVYQLIIVEAMHRRLFGHSIRTDLQLVCNEVNCQIGSCQLSGDIADVDEYLHSILDKDLIAPSIKSPSEYANFSDLNDTELICHQQRLLSNFEKERIKNSNPSTKIYRNTVRPTNFSPPPNLSESAEFICNRQQTSPSSTPDQINSVAQSPFCEIISCCDDSCSCCSDDYSDIHSIDTRAVTISGCCINHEQDYIFKKNQTKQKSQHKRARVNNSGNLKGSSQSCTNLNDYVRTAWQSNLDCAIQRQDSISKKLVCFENKHVSLKQSLSDQQLYN